MSTDSASRPAGRFTVIGRTMQVPAPALRISRVSPEPVSPSGAKDAERDDGRVQLHGLWKRNPGALTGWLDGRLVIRGLYPPLATENVIWTKTKSSPR